MISPKLCFFVNFAKLYYVQSQEAFAKNRYIELQTNTTQTGAIVVAGKSDKICLHYKISHFNFVVWFLKCACPRVFRHYYSPRPQFCIVIIFVIITINYSDYSDHEEHLSSHEKRPLNHHIESFNCVELSREYPNVTKMFPNLI